MAFLFKSKKNADRAAAAKENGVVGSQGSLQSSGANPPRGLKEKSDMATGGPVQERTPGNSVNNSLNSVGGTATPSPEQQQNGRRAPSSEQQPQSDLPVSLAI